MKQVLRTLFLMSLILFSGSSFAFYYGQSLCRAPGYKCIKILKGQSWYSLFPNSEERMIVKKINRMNTPLSAGMVIAIPLRLGSVNLLDLAPFVEQITPPHRTVIKVNLKRLAWGAYNSEGQLVNWGPISGGKSYCPDIRRGCRTPVGRYTIGRKQGKGCVSSRYPLPKGGAPMPYCMHFYRGYAIHGSNVVPGFNASHGCVRVFTEDAKWLNQQFIEVGSTRVYISR